MNPLKAVKRRLNSVCPTKMEKQLIYLISLANVYRLFYPKAMTPGCTTQACGRDEMDALKKKLKLKYSASAQINQKNFPVSLKKRC